MYFRAGGDKNKNKETQCLFESLPIIKPSLWWTETFFFLLQPLHAPPRPHTQQLSQTNQTRQKGKKEKKKWQFIITVLSILCHCNVCPVCRKPSFRHSNEFQSSWIASVLLLSFDSSSSISWFRGFLFRFNFVTSFKSWGDPLEW